MNMRMMLLVIGIVILCGGAHAADPYVTGTYSQASGGHAVEFVLHNALAEGVLWKWFVETTDAGSVASPAGWSSSQNSREVEWRCTVAGAEVQPGSSLGGFAFISQGQPGTYGWWATDPWRGYGGVVTPELVPEPSALLALAGGLGVLGLPFIRRRRAR